MNASLGLSRVPRGLWYTVGAVGAAALILVGVVLFIRSHKIESSRQSVSQLLQRADNEISRGFYQAAVPYLERAMKSAQTRDSWMSIGKRAYAIAAATDDYGLLLSVTEKGTKSLPGSQQLWALRVLAQARGGNPSGAESNANIHLSDTGFQSFGTEAALRAHPDLNVIDGSASKDTQRIVETLTSRDPSLFETLAREIDSPGLLFDSALLYAWKGDLKAAYTLLVSLGKETNPEAGMLISYDSGEYESARSYYQGMPPSQQTPSFELLADDLYVLQKDYDRAATAYRRFAETHPDVSWSPYVDLAWLAANGLSARISEAHAIDLLQTASQQFPDQREVVLSLATLDRRSADLSGARAVLARYLKTHPRDLDANLLSMQISGASVNPERERSRLWQLFYSATGEGRDRVARYLAWYLLGLNDYQGVELLFNQMKGHGDSEWIPFYRGIHDALIGKYPDSASEFQTAYGIAQRWQTLYNLGIVKLQAGDPKSAADDFQKADSYLSAKTGSSEATAPADSAAPIASESRSRDRAAIHVALATAFDQMGNSEAAKREVLYAQDMDPNNLSAALLLKKLDSAGQR